MKAKKLMTMLVTLAMIASTMIVINEMTDIRIVGNARASTPGVDLWQGNGSLAAAGDVINTSTTSLKYAPTTAVIIRVNQSLSWSGTYYLYYPVYSGSKNNGSFYNLTWEKYLGSGNGLVPQVNTANSDYQFGGGDDRNVYLNRSGLWLIDNNGAHDCSSTDQMNSTVPAWFWVNTSADSLVATPSDTSFYYGDTGTFSVTVDAGSTGVSEAIIAIYNNSGNLVGTWNYNKFTQGLTLGGTSALLTKNSSVFTNAGTWYLEAYADVDEDKWDNTISYYDGTSSKNWFNKSWFGNTATIENDATWYTYETCGPWDPPEYNDSVQKITVRTGQPTISLKNDSDVYWGFNLTLEVNATDGDGNGITGANISLRKQGTSTYIFTGTYSDVAISEVDSTNHPGNYTVVVDGYTSSATSNWTNLANGSWYVYVAKDINGDGKEEWNKSKRFSIKSSTPPVRIKMISDGDSTTGTLVDNKVHVPAFTSATNAIGTTAIQFQILGTDVGDNQGRRYYGDDTTPLEDRHNISVTGDILFPVTDATLTHGSNGIWTATVTPTKPGGTITITVDWPGSNNGTATETVSIVNGTHVTANIEKFQYGEERDITATVKDKFNNLQYAAQVYLIWQAGPTRLNQTALGTGASGKGENGEYTYHIEPSDMPASAPDNITIAARSSLGHWGYAKIYMSKNHEITVNCSISSGYAGDLLEFDVDVLVDGAAPDGYLDINVKLYNDEGTLITGDNAWSSTGSYDINNQEHFLAGGTYQLYAYNDTHDSQGHNATLIITKYIVTATPNTLAWKIDTSRNMTFQITPSANGSLIVENLSSGNKNGSANGQEYVVDINDGAGSIIGVNASTLGNLTYDFTPDGGEQREAEGLTKITTATASSDPATIYIGEVTTVEITVIHPATQTALENVRVDLDYGKNLSTSKLEKLPDYETTDANGKAYFAVTAAASGNVTIYLQRGTDPDNPMIILAAAKKTMTITTDPSVKEGDKFTVSAKDSNGNLITDATVSILFNGETETTTTGTLELTSPTVPESLDYRIEATATGYTNANTQIKVINKPMLYVKAPATGIADEAITVTAGGDDGNSYGITVSVYSDEACTTLVDSDTTAGPSGVTFTLKKGTYFIKASKDNYVSSATATVKVTAATPGFELLTLVAALGIAFILLRRRKQK